jgi:hypothetical protein
LDEIGGYMSNPIKQIVNEAGNTPHQVLTTNLAGVVSNTTFYNLIDNDGIPGKTRWETIVKVANALGYKVIFEKDRE